MLLEASRMRGVTAAVLSAAAGICLAWTLCGCRLAGTRSTDSPPRQTAVTSSTPTTGEAPSSPADDYLSTEAAHMAAEDQQRAKEALDRKERARHRDSPLRPTK